MAQKPSVKRIVSENLPSGKAFGWLPSLVEPVNSFFDQVSRALNNRLTVSENFDGGIKAVTLDGTFPVKIAWDRAKPQVVIVGNTQQISGTDTPPSAAVYIGWEYTQDQTIQINFVHGITPTETLQYKLTLLILVS